MIKVSVIIPAYNVKKYIGRAIDSILRQSLEEIEVIVINDGSTDGTLNEINRIYKTDSRVRVIDSTNGGVSKARNTGIEMAIGEYILFLDSDDWLEKESLNELYYAAKKDNIDMMIFNWSNVIKGVKNKSMSITEKKNISGDEAIKDILIGKIPAAIWNKFTKRSKFNNGIRLNESIFIGEDLLFSIELCKNCDKIVIIPDSYYCYNIHSDSATQNVNERVYTIRDSIIAIEKKLEIYKLDDKYKNELEYLKYMHLYIYRVIVGNAGDLIHKNFYLAYKNKQTIKTNPYFNEFMKNSTIDVKLRIYLYDFNYDIARAMHKIISKILK